MNLQSVYTGIAAYVLDCDITVSELEFQSCHDVLFLNKTLGNCVNPLIPPAMG